MKLDNWLRRSRLLKDFYIVWPCDLVFNWVKVVLAIFGRESPKDHFYDSAFPPSITEADIRLLHNSINPVFFTIVGRNFTIETNFTTETSTFSKLFILSDYDIRPKYVYLEHLFCLSYGYVRFLYLRCILMSHASFCNLKFHWAIVCLTANRYRCYIL